MSSLNGTRRVRVLVVDDSLFMRAAIKKTLSTCDRIEVIGQGKDGKDGVDKVLALSPDVVTMDFNMPVLDGAAAVRQIMKRKPTPVIMFSAHTTQGARETFEALAAGAVDFVTKPGGEVSADLSEIADDLIAKVLAAAGARPQVDRPVPPARRPSAATAASSWPPTRPRVVIIGVSTGGPVALSRLIPTLPGDTRSAYIVVQHMPAQFTAALADRLDTQSAVHVREARDGDVPQRGLVLIAPGDRHLEIDDGGVLRLDDGPKVNNCRPAVDVTMKAAARVFGRRAIGVILTGMGRDGADGMQAIKAADGKTFAQDRETSVIFGMPKAAIDAGVVDQVLALDDLAAVLAAL